MGVQRRRKGPAPCCKLPARNLVHAGSPPADEERVGPRAPPDGGDEGPGAGT